MWLLDMLELKMFITSHLEPDLLIILLINIAMSMVTIRKWRKLKIIPGAVITADDFSGFDDIVFEEEEEDIATENIQRPEDIFVAVECTFEASTDNRDLMYYNNE